jgi:hypothetical protein
MNKRDRQRALRALDRIERDRALVWDLIAPRDEHGERQYPADVHREPEAVDKIREGGFALRAYVEKQG